MCPVVMQRKCWLVVHDDHHATSSAAKPIPMAMAASVSRNFSFIFILLFTKLAARVIWIAAVMVAGKVQLILAAVEVFRSHAVKV